MGQSPGQPQLAMSLWPVVLGPDEIFGICSSIPAKAHHDRNLENSSGTLSPTKLLPLTAPFASALLCLVQIKT